MADSLFVREIIRARKTISSISLEANSFAAVFSSKVFSRYKDIRFYPVYSILAVAQRERENGSFQFSESTDRYPVGG